MFCGRDSSIRAHHEMSMSVYPKLSSPVSGSSNDNKSPSALTLTSRTNGPPLVSTTTSSRSPSHHHELCPFGDSLCAVPPPPCAGPGCQIKDAEQVAASDGVSLSSFSLMIFVSCAHGWAFFVMPWRARTECPALRLGFFTAVIRAEHQRAAVIHVENPNPTDVFCPSRNLKCELRRSTYFDVCCFSARPAGERTGITSRCTERRDCVSRVIHSVFCPPSVSLSFGRNEEHVSDASTSPQAFGDSSQQHRTWS